MTSSSERLGQDIIIRTSSIQVRTFLSEHQSDHLGQEIIIIHLLAALIFDMFLNQQTLSNCEDKLTLIPFYSKFFSPNYFHFYLCLEDQMNNIYSQECIRMMIY